MRFICALIMLFVIMIHIGFYGTSILAYEEIGRCGAGAPDSLTTAALENDTEEVKSVLDCENVDINKKDSSGQYPIEMALIMDNYHMAKLLLGVGADPFVRRSDGQRIYDVAINSSNRTLRSLFLEYSGYRQSEKAEP